MPILSSPGGGAKVHQWCLLEMKHNFGNTYLQESSKPCYCRVENLWH